MPADHRGRTAFHKAQRDRSRWSTWGEPTYIAAVRTSRRQSDAKPSFSPQLLPSEPMLFANLRIYFADFPECTFLYVPEHFMLGDLMR